MSKDITPRAEKYIANVVAGMSKRQAALSAGYSNSMAHNATTQIETPRVRMLLRDALESEGVTSELIAQKVKAGLDAQRVIYATKDGVITDTQEVTDFGERRQMTELAAKLRGDLDVGININLNQILANIPEEFEELMAITDVIDLDAGDAIISNGVAESLEEDKEGLD